MGSGSWTTASYSAYASSSGKLYSATTGRVTGQVFHQSYIDPSLDPKHFMIRECVDSDEHPNTVPIILGLDVTGSMGSACKETAEALNVIMTNLYKKYKDIEFCVMGIGDLAYDDAPIQMSQFESDVRIAEAVDKIYMEHGGGGNSYESYTAAWYMALKRTKLDRIEKQGRKGIIITMGDEPLNPYLPVQELNEAANCTEQADIETKPLFEEASKKFDIYHIAVKDHATAYDHYENLIKKSFGEILGDNLKVSTIDELPDTIEKCIGQSIQNRGDSYSTSFLNESNTIKW